MLIGVWDNVPLGQAKLTDIDQGRKLKKVSAVRDRFGQRSSQVSLSLFSVCSKYCRAKIVLKCTFSQIYMKLSLFTSIYTY